MEAWRAVPGWYGFYEASDQGRVRSVGRTIHVLDPWGNIGPRRFKGRVLRAAVTKKGYCLVALTRPDVKKTYAYVHALVLRAFRGEPTEGQEACHNNGVRDDNRLVNLRWDTRSANAQDRHTHGTFAACPRGERSRQAKLTDEAVRTIRRVRPLVTLQDLADEYGVSTTTISMAEHRKTWRHLEAA